MTDLLTMEGIGQRALSFWFELLDQFNSSIGTLDVDADSVPTISNNINRVVKRQLSGLRLPPSVTADVNTLRDRVRPWMVLQDGTQHPCGVFLFSDASRRLATYSSVQFADVGDGYTTEGTCLDQLATIDQGSRGINFYGPGHSVYDALVQQMDAAGVVDYYIEPSDAQFAQWVVWKPNAKRLTVINDICALGGYYSLYFDNIGTGQIRLVPSLDAVEPQFLYDAGRNVVDGSVVESDDLLSAPNSYVVVNSGFTERPIWGEWRVPASAPHSYETRGFYVVKEIDKQGIESNEAAARAAKAEGQADYATYRWHNFATSLQPEHDTFNVYSWKGDKYREQGWEMRLDDTDTMSHEGRRIWSEEVADVLLEAA